MLLAKRLALSALKKRPHSLLCGFVHTKSSFIQNQKRFSTSSTTNRLVLNTMDCSENVNKNPSRQLDHQQDQEHEDNGVVQVSERLRRAETVLSHRTGRIILVLEQCVDTHNHLAVLRTAEALGVQNVWLIQANAQQIKNKKQSSKKITKNCSFWLSVRQFTSIADCLIALREANATIWATDLSPQALPMTLQSSDNVKCAKPETLPEKVAIVIGREIDGVSQEMLKACHQRVYFPIYGFSESLNLSVASALILQRVFDWFPQIRGDLTDAQQQEIRQKWASQLIYKRKRPQSGDDGSRDEITSRAFQQWTKAKESGQIELLDDLRRQDSHVFLSKRVRQLESQLAEVQERTGGTTSNLSPSSTTSDVKSS